MKNMIAFLLCFVALSPVRAQWVAKATGTTGSSTAYVVPLPDVIVDTDHIGGATGKTGTVYLTRIKFDGTVSKGASTNSIVEVDSVNAPGQYTLALTVTELQFAGFIKGYYKATGTDPVSFTLRVVGNDPDNAANMGLSDLSGLRTDYTTTKAGYIDVAVSSRSTYAGADTAGTTTLLGRLTSTRAVLLDNLDATISSRSTYAGGDTVGVTTLLSRLSTQRAANLDNLDAAISALKTVTDGLGTTLENGVGAGVKRFTAAALYNAPAGEGGGGSSATVLVRGSFTLTPSNAVNNVLTCTIGNAFTVGANLTYDNQSAAPTDGTLTGKLTLNGTVKASGLTVTVRYGNLVTVAIPSSATDVAGNLLLTITRTSGSDVQTFGPLTIRVLKP
jgi:hypothetical protein